MSRRYYLVAFGAVLLSLACLTIFRTPNAEAINGGNWQAGRIIDDAIFTDTSMSVGQIQDFLNQQVPSCDTNGTQRATEWGRPDLTHAQFATQVKGWPGPPYVCLRNYYEVPKSSPSAGIPDNSYNNNGNPPANSISAAQMIYNAAQQYRISPKVLLVKLQTESAGPLTQDNWPLLTQYTYAMGAHCPDSGPGGAAQCDSNYAGFSMQIAEAAALLRYYLDNMQQPWWSNKKPYTTNSILWNVSPTGCGAGSVYIATKATAALYTYTPYQPNAAALQKVSSSSSGGTGDGCSAYGNRNFWWWFNTWFGNSQGNNYAWSIDSLTYSGGDNIFPTGQTETVTLRAQNVGLNPWYNHGDGPVKLATWEPANRGSSLFPSNRLATLQENVVMPGEVGTFVFTVTPTTVGTFAESLNLVVEGYTWMEWPGFRPTIVVPPAYQWQVQNVVYDKGTGYMDPGETQLITVIAKNTGSATWSKSGGAPVRLGTWQPQRPSGVASNWLSSIRAADMNETTVAPGQNAGFQFYVRMPTSGLQYERLNLVAEGQAWFNDAGLTLYLSGNDYSWSVDSVNYSSGTGYMNPGSTQTVTVKARNTGTATWHNNGDLPIKLGTWVPQRQSAVGATWPSTTRMATLSESSVAPGQVGTFTATVNMPATGMYYEKMNLVAEGIKWFNDPGLTFYLQGR